MSEYETGQSLLVNHGMIPVWNLLAGDTVIVDGKIATVHSDPAGGMVELLVYDIVENDEVAPNGEWLATPSVVVVKFGRHDEIAFVQTAGIATRRAPKSESCCGTADSVC
jgi:hypothetical protein